MSMKKRIYSGLIALGMAVSSGAIFMPSYCSYAIESQTESVAERTAAAKERYLSKLAEAKALSADDYSADSYALYQNKLSGFNVETILGMVPNFYVAAEYNELCYGIDYAKSFLNKDKNHTFYNDLEELINYGESLNPDDYTEESFQAFTEKFTTLKTGEYSLSNAWEKEKAGNGINIYTYFIINQYRPCFDLLVRKDRVSIEKTDNDTGITLASNSDHIAQEDTFVVRKYDNTNWDWSESDSYSLKQVPNMCDNYVRYNISLFNENGILRDMDDVYSIVIPVPDEYNINSLQVQIFSNRAAMGSIARTVIDKENRVVTVTYQQGYLDMCNGGSIVLKTPITAVNPTKLTDDGVYSITANLTAFSDAAKTSMADAAINHASYLTKSGDDIAVYIDFKPIYVIDKDTPSYCGGLWSEKGTSRDGEYYTDSETILSYYTESNGTIRDNDIYDGVTQIPCVKTIKLDLESDCYNRYGGYTLVVSSPSMAALNHIAFEDYIWDELLCNLMISNATYLGTLDQASSYLPTYDITALQREYEYANILADDNIYTDESWADVQALLDTETTTEDKKCVTGYSDTAELTARIAEYQSATAALVVDENKKIADGRYLVPAHMIKTDRASDSMSENAINHNVVVDVKDGKATVQVEFKGMAIDDKFGYLEKLSYFNAGYEYNGFGAPVGEVTEATVINKYDVIDEYSGKNPPHYLEFPLVDGKGAEWIPLQVFVPVMEAVSTGSGTQSVLMHLDWENKVPAGKIAEYTGNTLSLKDDFGLNFFFNFGEQTLNDAGAKVKFTLPDGSVKEYVISEIADADKTANGYKFSANVAAKEMTAPVKVQVILSNGETSEVFSCSVKEYADKLIASSTNESEIALVKSILNYGGYAQEFFGYNKTALANADLTGAEKTLGDVTIANTKRERVEDEDDGINFYGSSLSLNTKIDLKAYFTLEDGAKISDYTFKIGSTELTPVESGNKYYVTIPDITSRDIDERSAIEIANKSGEGELSVKTGPYAYIYKALSKSSDEKLQSLMKALYFYSQAAENYNA